MSARVLDRPNNVEKWGSSEGQVSLRRGSGWVIVETFLIPSTGPFHFVH